MKNTFADGVIDQGEGRAEHRLRGSFVLRLQGDAELADLMTKPGAVHATEGRALAGLFDFLESGFMTCHRLSFSTEYEMSIYQMSGRASTVRPHELPSWA